MRKRIFFAIMIAAVCFSGCSRIQTESAIKPVETVTNTEKESIVVPGATINNAETESVVDSTEEKREDAKKEFGERFLTMATVQDKDGMTKYFSEENEAYYFDNATGLLCLIKGAGNAKTEGKTSNSSMLSKAEEILVNVSDVYKNKDVGIEITSDGVGYSVKCVCDAIPGINLAEIFFDAGGDIIAGYFNPKAYDVKDADYGYNENDYIVAAKNALKEELGDGYEAFMTADVGVSVVNDNIAGRNVKCISFKKTDGEMVLGYLIYVYADDLSIELISQYK